ncbi:Endoplasmic reticulum chaperone BiP [Rhizophlyctis rosea]|uniref:Endoplasmic reticulum chaperone BiP n=1 Tax=Rhizophlyctis rosea TaxID=64517 RepID=A0AAD5SD75_9FUNG|nr:Endoplasmic reticulum chaperone BiP [Rhizophlyctis rosea]
MPSYVAFTDDGQILVGVAAKAQADTNPQNTIYGMKHLIGRDYTDPKVQQAIKNFPFRVVEVENKPVIVVRVNGLERSYGPEEVASFLLAGLREEAEYYFGQKIDSAVSAVPVRFSDRQRQATRDAGLMAGLKVERILNEPTAVAIGYDLDKLREKDILVIDLDNTTYDVSLLTIDDGVFEVLADHTTHLQGSEPVSLKSLLLPVREILAASHFELCARDEPCTSMEVDSSTPLDRVHELIFINSSPHHPQLLENILNLFPTRPNVHTAHSDALVRGLSVHAKLIGSSINIGGEQPLLDIPWLNFGIETGTGIFKPILSSHQALPSRRSINVTTQYDAQTTMQLKLFMGLRPIAKDNQLLHTLELKDIPPAPRGVARIKVEVEIDVSGKLGITASKPDADMKETWIESWASLDGGWLLEKLMDDHDTHLDEDDVVREKMKAMEAVEGFVWSVGDGRDDGDKEQIGIDVQRVRRQSEHDEL